MPGFRQRKHRIGREPRGDERWRGLGDVGPLRSSYCRIASISIGSGSDAGVRETLNACDAVTL
ncbi:hypothetical protein PC129_g17064 [Phytophthora cactorum]|uniref:Uncharacterized protein n=1 Tax=Phytophthora cactorum TaxID=29920 RepID=A0A8T1HL21_9STRA|nr:hypothetical protein Pcac1_g9445 [Phytophthora cactorum]KAG2871497.1 hypothetical protein PC114_g26888 [Phytophthora cactorum]KAG2879145.1 hypothetical protein PC117_g26816 [Phytophthora cactorum]KAG2959696.1 hypothetical protein PC119_g26631 [Phytophthora cactorum]KAG2970949.1 hypothetical protein PC120_g26520 [Phytophthora cactorum]